MQNTSIAAGRIAGVIAIIMVVGAGASSVERPEALKPSHYAPMGDLSAQVESIVKAIGKDLQDEAEYGPDHQNRIFLNAHTLIVLGHTLAVHDEDHPLKQSAAGLTQGAAKLADSVEDHAAAQQALAAVEQALENRAGGSVDADIAADLPALMRQVPIVNNSLRRGVLGRRFERMIDQSAGEATTLAAIAQVAMSYTDYCGDEEGEVKWAQICADMRNAAVEVRTAVRNKDLPTATAGLARLVETCDACHHEFRD